MQSTSERNLHLLIAVFLVVTMLVLPGLLNWSGDADNKDTLKVIASQVRESSLDRWQNTPTLVVLRQTDDAGSVEVAEYRVYIGDPGKNKTFLLDKASAMVVRDPTVTQYSWLVTLSGCRNKPLEKECPGVAKRVRGLAQ